MLTIWATLKRPPITLGARTPNAPAPHGLLLEYAFYLQLDVSDDRHFRKHRNTPIRATLADSTTLRETCAGVRGFDASLPGDRARTW